MTLRSIASRTSRPSWPVAYLPTGVLCNQIAMHALVRPGRFVVAEASSHVASAEATSSAALSGIASRRIRAERGCLLTPSHVAHALMPDPHDVEVVDLVAIENTHQWAAAPRCPLTMRGRSPRSVPLAVSPLCLGRREDLQRVSAMNGTTVADYAGAANATMFCLSEALGAPIGSILVGDGDFIRETRRLKIVFGGAWRQEGS